MLGLDVLGSSGVLGAAGGVSVIFGVSSILGSRLGGASNILGIVVSALNMLGA